MNDRHGQAWDCAERERNKEKEGEIFGPRRVIGQRERETLMLDKKPMSQSVDIIHTHTS